MPDFPSSSRRRIPAAGLPQDGATIAQAALVVVAVLYFARDLLVPLALAILLSFILAPIARALRRWGLPRVPGVILSVLAAVLVLASLGLVMGRQLAELAAELPAYQAEVTRKLASINASGGLVERAQAMLRGLSNGVEREPRAPLPRGLHAEAVQPIPVEIRQPDPAALETLQNVLAPLVTPLATAGIVIVLVIFVLLYREDLRDRVIRLVGARDLHRTVAAMDDAAYRLSRFFLAQTALNAAFGAFMGMALFAIGVPQPILWGILAGLMRFVPFVGTFVAVAFPLLLALATDPGWTMPIMVLILFAIGEGAMGQVVEPMVFGHSTGLSPIAIIAAATFWTWLWGPVGLLVAVPLTVCLVVLGKHVDRLEFLEVALGDRPPLDPPETFYQRALMGDADGLEEQAEMVLRDAALSAYYDTVALPALALAQGDALRGGVAEERILAVHARVAALLEDLEEEEEGPPEKPLTDPASDLPPPIMAQAPASLVGPGSVLCLPGRGPFDDAAAMMLAQVLRKRGIGAVVAPPELLRGEVTGFDLRLVRQAWLCAVEGGSSSAAARYLLRRLRRRMPEAQICAMVACAGPEARLPAALRAEAAVAVEPGIAAAVKAAMRIG
ncbi:AI-2E family transporter [Falsiroseomonas stagni]|uniref:Predicted PurR-regulated permease PerM n=1 Tax=Falsiroseomonas stagni DSM 19981 TaxID=1123062 RepID=A0A1I4CPA3_9PROT|nr:AI-2E family transporter [Falsiroseomonas stagni]SFK83082.1 Predicted PurR-regulated permease PerM [Falsiroseomonas stagni DSM 19981]